MFVFEMLEKWHTWDFVIDCFSSVGQLPSWCSQSVSALTKKATMWQEQHFQSVTRVIFIMWISLHRFNVVGLWEYAAQRFTLARRRLTSRDAGGAGQFNKKREVFCDFRQVIICAFVILELRTSTLLDIFQPKTGKFCASTTKKDEPLLFRQMSRNSVWWKTDVSLILVFEIFYKARLF